MKKYILSMFLGGVLFILPYVSLAHERQVFQIGDKQYQFVVGSLNEPAIVDDKAGVDLHVSLMNGPAGSMDHNANASMTPMTGLEKTLKAEVSAGDKKKTFDFEPAFNNPGVYHAVFFPTVATTYTYRIFGTLQNVPVDLNFACSSGSEEGAADTSVVKISDKVSRIAKVGAFGCPAAKTDNEFPEKTASSYDLSQTAAGALAKANSASGSAVTALALALVGIGIGIVAWLKARA